jgi:hypothetical protein
MEILVFWIIAHGRRHSRCDFSLKRGFSKTRNSSSLYGTVQVDQQARTVVHHHLFSLMTLTAFFPFVTYVFRQQYQAVRRLRDINFEQRMRCTWRTWKSNWKPDWSFFACRLLSELFHKTKISSLPNQLQWQRYIR